LMDGGTSDEVLMDINSLQYQQAYALYLDLLSISPALSEEVMIAAIQKEYELPKALLTHILASNPQAAKNAKVQDALDLRTNPLSEYQRNQINTGRLWLSEVELLEADIVGVNTQIEKEIFKYFVSNAPVADYLNALDDENYNENLLKAAVLAESGMLDEARILLEKAASKKESFIDPNSISTCLQIMAINYDLRHGQLPMSGNNEQQLLAIWENNTNGMGAFAHTLLETFAGYAPEENASGELRVEEAQSEVSAAGNGLDVMLWPVPASEFINVKFDTQNNSAAKMVVYNYNGQSVLEHNLNQGQVESVLDISTFSAGFYTLTITNPNTNEILGSKFFYKK
jgi:Secretion system C-terminal sorting domain